ncbi:MAG: DegQ family serine endoprotease [Deltaproteobacteria bacterium]|nr:DegQ family serine endoprotease [Deltaproteobacteria bacterium]
MKLRVLRIGAVTVAMSAVLIAGISVYQKSTYAVNVTLSPHPAFATSGSTTVADVAERVLPSVVNVASSREVERSNSPMYGHPLFRDFFRFKPTPRQQRGLGSGVIVDKDGIVLTNNHVVAKATKIRVALSNGREFDAKIIGTDPKSDVAVLRLKGAKNLRPIAFGNSDQIRLGEIVLAVGNPFGVGQTVTMGIVSAKGRANVGIVDYENFIQTDAAINPGNSGGALVNMRGELIGINTAILSRSGGYQGIGFAIPSNMARPIMTSLIKTGKVVRGWLGVAIQTPTQDMARMMNLPTTRGVLVSDVDPRGPAHRAGLRRGDLIVKVDGHQVASTGDLRNRIAAAGAKAQVQLEFYRGSRKMSQAIRLGELPMALGGTGQTGQRTGGGGGIAVENLDATARNKYGIPQRLASGVVVTGVRPGSPADQAGLQPGDVILEVNRAKITDVGRFTSLYAAARGRVLLLVHRGALAHYLILQK